QPPPVVDQRDGATDLARELARGIGRAFYFRAALIAPPRQLGLRTRQHRVGTGREPHSKHDGAQRRDERTDCRTRQEAGWARDVETTGVERDALELAAAGDGDDLR